MNPFCFRIVLLAIALVTAPVVNAQTTTGAILGEVADASGALLPGATVSVTNQRTGAVREVLTNEIGTFRFSALAPVEYTLTAAFSEFNTVTRPNIKVPVASSVTINFILEVAAIIGETITVTSEAPLVETTDNAVKTLIDSRRINDLPLVSRDFMDLALLAPGVVLDQGSASTGVTESISFAGMSERYKSIWLDGVDLNDEVTGGGSGISTGTRVGLTQETIQEFQVMANSYSAEYGRSGSGVINVVTKSGGNEFHGNGFYFLRDDAFDKPNFFSETVPPFRLQQTGGTLGGPIVRDRAFFFTSYEYLRDEGSATVFIPAQLRDFVSALGYDTRTDVPVPKRKHNVFAKGSFLLNPENTLTVSYLYDRRRFGNVQVGGNIAGDHGYDDTRDSYIVSANLTSLLGSNVVNELRFAQSHQHTARDLPAGNTSMPELNFPSIRFGQASNVPQGRDQNNWIVSSATNYNFVGGVGQHDLKFGAEMNLVVNSPNTRNGPPFNGAFTFSRDLPVDPSDPSTLPFRYVEGIEVRGPKLFKKDPQNCTLPDCPAPLIRDTHIYALFVNDNWQIHPTLSLNLGVRYDVQFWRADLNGEDIPTDIPEFEFWQRLLAGDLKGSHIKAFPNDKNNIAPRIGLAWNPGNTGRTVLRGGYGIYYDQITTSQHRSLLALLPGFINTSVSNDVRLTGTPNDFFPNKIPDISTLPEAGSTRFGVPNPTSQFPYSQQFTGGIQQDLGGNYAFTVDYVYMYALHFSRTRNVNAPLESVCNPRVPGSCTYPLLPGVATRVEIPGDTGAILKSKMLQLRFEKRFADRFGFLFGYTAGSTRGTIQSNPANHYDLNAEFGPEPNDVRHRVIGNFMTALPYGIQFASVLQYNTKAPYNITTGRDDNGDRQRNDRPAGVGRNSGRGDGYFVLDLRSSKKFFFGEQTNLEVLWEMFNLTNTDNLTRFQGNMRSSSFGKARRALAPFQAQLGLKFTF